MSIEAGKTYSQCHHECRYEKRMHIHWTKKGKLP